MERELTPIDLEVAAAFSKTFPFPLEEMKAALMICGGSYDQLKLCLVYSLKVNVPLLEVCHDLRSI